MDRWPGEGISWSQCPKTIELATSTGSQDSEFWLSRLRPHVTTFDSGQHIRLSNYGKPHCLKPETSITYSFVLWLLFLAWQMFSDAHSTIFRKSQDMHKWEVLLISTMVRTQDGSSTKTSVSRLRFTIKLLTELLTRNPTCNRMGWQLEID